MIDSIEIHGLREYHLTGKRPRFVLNGVEYDSDRLSYFVGVSCLDLKKDTAWDKTYTSAGGFGFASLLLHFLLHIHRDLQKKGGDGWHLYKWAIYSRNAAVTVNRLMKRYWTWRSEAALEAATKGEK